MVLKMLLCLSAHQLCRVDLDARAHGGSHDAGADILALGSSRLGLDDRAHQSVEVVLQLLRAEGSLADRAVDDVGLVQTVLDLTSFRFLNRFDNVRSYGAGLRGWHQASWTKDFTQTANNAHHVRACDDNVEIHPATLDLLHVLVSAGIVCTSSQSSIHLVALAEYHDANGFAGAVWQNNRATNLLIRMAGMVAEKVKNPQEKYLMISHCNNPEKAEWVRSMIMEQVSFAGSFILNTAGISSMYANDGGIIITA